MSHTWSSVRLYGVEHSPWVQGIDAALSFHGVPTRLTSFPLSIGWALSNGLVFPALELSDGTRIVDSFSMYERLQRDGFDLGFERLDPDVRLERQVELENLFSAYVLGRCMPSKRWAFIQGWSRMRERPFTVSGIVSRALLANYFWVLIRLGIRLDQRKGRTPFDLNLIERHLQTWDARLAEHPWLSGSTIGFVDFALFGHVQCMCTGLTDEVLPLLRAQTHLMRWLKRMLETLPARQTHRYALRLVDPGTSPPTASRKEQISFWVAWTGWALGWPLSMVMVAYGLMARTTNPAHSGAVRRRQNKRRPQGQPSASRPSSTTKT